jgi:hypothetical protein
MTQPPLQTKITKGEIHLVRVQPLRFTMEPYFRFTTYLRSGFRIAKASITKEKPLSGSEEEIIEQIHSIRYNETNPYVITGGHFSQLFVRNLGVFFNALLDPRIPTTDQDWIDRQSIGVKTVAFDLELFQQAKKEYVTLTPVKDNLYTGLNLYARPSDSLYAILYTLCALQDDTFIETSFPSKKLSKKKLMTKTVGKELTKSYAPLLKSLVEIYLQEIIDPETNLVKKNLLLASARDGIKRECSFYDNVIAWATVRLANKLNLHKITEKELLSWKKKIIDTFWDEQTGIFLDDLSDASVKNKWFSSDSFIVLSTGFLQTKNSKEKVYFERMIAYVKKKKLDVPFPLHYSTQDVPKLLYRPVRYFAPSYMGTSIWSHWGMEYIKTLHYLGYETDARNHLLTYKKNIEKYGGYPEVYDKNGKLLHTRTYRSVLHTGWVINYEQVKMLLTEIKK